jgi:hypothetical protein
MIHFRVIALAGTLLLAACGDTHNYIYPAPEQQEPAPTPEPIPQPQPEPTPPPATTPQPPAGTEYRQFWFATIHYQIQQATLACRITVAAPTATTTRITLDGCQDGTSARAIISTTAGSYEKTITATNPLVYTLHADINTAEVYAILTNGLSYPNGSPMIHQGTIRWHKLLIVAP